MAEILKKLFGFGQKEETRKKAVTTDKVPDGGGGFSVKVAVPANSTTIHAAAPVIARCYGNGGIQGLTWYAENLRADDDGDVAQEFLEEIIPKTQVDPSNNKKSTPAGFEAVTHTTRPVKLKGPVCIQDGNVHQSVEFSG
ncbi:unnamed protein product [Sphagnum compactum]